MGSFRNYHGDLVVPFVEKASLLAVDHIRRFRFGAARPLNGEARKASHPTRVQDNFYARFDEIAKRLLGGRSGRL